MVVQSLGVSGCYFCVAFVVAEGVVACAQPARDLQGKLQVVAIDVQKRCKQPAELDDEEPKHLCAHTDLLVACCWLCACVHA
jgi:hypothetical protein